MALHHGGEIPEGINVTPSRPLNEFLLYVGGIIAVLGLLFWGLAALGSALAVHLPASYEKRLGSWYRQAMALDETAPSALKAEATLQTILDELAADLPKQPWQYQVKIRCTSQKNAFAIPGGQIVVFSALLKKLENQPQLAMLLAHELGHQLHRDSLHALGRSLAIMAPMMVLGFSDSSGLASKVAGFSAQLLLLHHSREQELKADDFALSRLQKLYPGQEVAGISLFRVLGDLEPVILQQIPSWSLTHPQPLERYERLMQPYAKEFKQRHSRSSKPVRFTDLCPDDADKNTPPTARQNPKQNKSPS